LRACGDGFHAADPVAGHLGTDTCTDPDTIAFADGLAFDSRHDCVASSHADREADPTPHAASDGAPDREADPTPHAASDGAPDREADAHAASEPTRPKRLADDQ
jgi:hypothetical protein